MSYYEDAINQFESILYNRGNQNVKDLYKDKLKKIFLGIYSINYLSNRIELDNFFSTDYYNISFSCLLEAFALILNNYPRGSSLVLRSSLENFVKHIIETSNKIYTSNYDINDRSYTENKKTLENIIKDKYEMSLKERSIRLNSQMECYYKRLSALSHSLIPESKNNTISYFSEVSIINNVNLDIVFDKHLEIIKAIFGFSIMICQSSLKNWESVDLQKILRMVFSKGKSERLLKSIKST